MWHGKLYILKHIINLDCHMLSRIIDMGPTESGMQHLTNLVHYAKLSLCVCYSEQYIIVKIYIMSGICKYIHNNCL